jgi:hypothetical protein
MPYWLPSCDYNSSFDVNGLIYLILPAALGPRVYSASNRNEYQKERNYVSGK